MKGFKRIIVWALLSIMMQVAALLYLDKVYLKHSSEFQLKEVKEDVVGSKADLSIPQGAKKIQSSYDGKYISYFVDSKFYLLDTKTGTSEEIITNKGNREVLNSEWLPDRNRLTIAEKVTSSSKKNVINVINYDAKNKTESQITENEKVCDYKSGMQVDAIETTTLSGVTFVSVSKGGNNAVIYRINIEKNVESIGSNISAMGEMKVSPSSDSIIYQDKKAKRFYEYTNGKASKINITNSSNLTLLARDSNGVVYMGEESEDKVTKIFSGTLNQKFATWKVTQLDKPKNSTDIYVNDKGEFLVNDSLDGKVKNLTTSESVSYKGKFIFVNNKVILSSDNGKIYLTSLSK
ncbi:dipeptidyl-peptidase IV [Clostridium cibarium]|uniref:Dipeptidyl-peptidase IV n=1 Tax=Clostridium cibarium TaxID=2762247 RepID=A0ABR8PT62_9CLOT|nr:dipeptidyl-peptidase IV [Clostridium cibarium]MBD7911358.1 dipeptidyl-peptidase IV [Clostridium cibarium]